MMKGFFLSRSLPVPQAGSFAEPRKKDAPCVWPVLQMMHGQNVSQVRNSLAGSVRFASGRNPWTAWFFCVLMTE